MTVRTGNRGIRVRSVHGGFRGAQRAFAIRAGNPKTGAITESSDAAMKGRRTLFAQATRSQVEGDGGDTESSGARGWEGGKRTGQQPFEPDEIARMRARRMWRDRVLLGAENALRARPEDEAALREEGIKRLQRKIGELATWTSTSRRKRFGSALRCQEPCLSR